jgi:hypothetical protein
MRINTWNLLFWSEPQRGDKDRGELGTFRASSASLFFFFFFFWFFETGFPLYSPGCPGTHFVDQAGRELRNPPASASQVLSSSAFLKIASVQSWRSSGTIWFFKSKLHWNNPEMTHPAPCMAEATIYSNINETIVRYISVLRISVWNSLFHGNLSNFFFF